MADDHDARITANEDDIDDTRRTTHTLDQRLVDHDRRLDTIEAILRRLLSRM